MIPLKDFFRKPEKLGPQLSPTGKFLAYLSPWERRMNIHVNDRKTDTVRRLTSVKDRDLSEYMWLTDKRLLFVKDKGGDENTHLYAIDRDGSNIIDLTPFDNVKCDIIDELHEQDDFILFQMNKRDPQIFDVYRLNVKTGEMEMAAKNPGNVSYWLTDHDGHLRSAFTTDGVDAGILFRESEDSNWQEIASYNFKESARPVLFTFDNAGLYVLSNVGRDKTALCTFDLKDFTESEILFEHPDVGISNVFYSKKRKLLEGVSFITEKPGFHFFDEKRVDLQKLIASTFPAYHNEIIQRNRAETHAVVFSRSDRNNGFYSILDMEKKVVDKLFEKSPWLRENQLAEMKPIHFTTRDGLKIPGYLSLPVGKSENLPLIVNPHGGPWVRDEWRYNPEVQFLVSRGYAVLQINYRGSAGYGRVFLEKAFGKWGLSMQEDIEDGVNWAIEQKFADPGRIVIYGASYGGYAALMGIVKTPGLYKAAVDYVGVSSLFTFFESFPPYWEKFREMMYEMVGHPEKDKEQFELTSPVFHVDKIKTPLFIAQGANDPRVKKAESDQMVAALRKRGIDVEYMVKDNEGHGFQNEENQFDFYEAMEKFLDKHLTNQSLS